MKMGTVEDGRLGRQRRQRRRPAQDDHQPETLRFLLLTTHYRRPIDYSEDRLEEVQRSLDGFYRFFERYQRITGSDFYNRRRLDAARAFDLSGTPSRIPRRRCRPAARRAFLEAWTTISTPAAPSACCTSC